MSALLSTLPIPTGSILLDAMDYPGAVSIGLFLTIMSATAILTRKDRPSI